MAISTTRSNRRNGNACARLGRREGAAGWTSCRTRRAPERYGWAGGADEAGANNGNSENAGSVPVVNDENGDDQVGGVPVANSENDGERSNIIDLRSDRSLSTLFGSPRSSYHSIEPFVPLTSFDPSDPALIKGFLALPAELRIPIGRDVMKIKCTARHRGRRSAPSGICPHLPNRVYAYCHPNDPDNNRTWNSAGLNPTPVHNPFRICVPCIEDTSNVINPMEVVMLEKHLHSVCKTCRLEEETLNPTSRDRCECFPRLRDPRGRKCHACRWDGYEQTEMRAIRHENRLKYVRRTNRFNKRLGEGHVILNFTERYYSERMRCRCGRPRSDADLATRMVLFCAGCRGLVVRHNLVNEILDVNDREWPIKNEKLERVPHN
ncbi:hypothetical protein MMC14_003004 [Varicellaria rhodocarpa]|nr:hypothetical protein [Varicellaria rhodocarpa]